MLKRITDGVEFDDTKSDKTPSDYARMLREKWDYEMKDETPNEPFIWMVDMRVGYCLNCGLPSVIGVFSLRGWKHEIQLCHPCVDSLAKKMIEGIRHMNE